MIATSLSELIDRLISALEARESREASDELRVRLVLASGIERAGILVERTRDIVVLRDDCVEHRIGLDHVVAVTLERADALRDILSNGKRERPQLAQTKMQLERELMRVSETLGVSVQAEAIPEANGARLALTEVIENVQHVLAGIFQEYGDEALAILHDVRIEDASPAGVEQRGDVVVIRADLEGGPRGRLGKAQLEKELLAIA